MKHRFTKIEASKVMIAVILLLLFVELIVFVINLLFKTQAPITLLAAEWTAGDALLFFGSVIAFIGTVSLAFVTLHQNNRLYEINLQMQKLEAVKYSPMVTLIKFCIEKHESDYNLIYGDGVPLETINLAVKGENSQSSYFLDFCLRNDSDYPIVQLVVHPGTKGNSACTLYGINSSAETTIHIPSRAMTWLRIVVPTEKLAMLNISEISFVILFTNVFDYSTECTINVSDVTNPKRAHNAKLKMSKFTDVRTIGRD